MQKRRTEIDFMVPGHLVTLAYLPGQSALSLEIRDAYSIVNSQTLPPPIISQRLDTSFLSQPHYTNYRFSIHASPILPNSSRLWVALSSPPDMARGGVSVGQGHDKMFFRYNVQYGEDGAISIHPCYNVVPNELVALPPPPHDTPISFAGTMIIDNDRHPREAHLYTISSQGITHKQLDAGDHGSCLHFSDYGGVLLHRSRKDKSVSIDYYK
ncbi:hypothetical protein H0H93_006357 [Arthromyces matolae]|nr:hypothetical protein H0H93_006357 [Arthromyces matolae]